MTGVVALAGTAVWPTSAGLRAGDGADNPPDWCFESNDQGDLPDCVYSNGEWSQTFDGGGFADPAAGIPAAFAAFFFLVVLLGVAGLVWRVSTARRLARSAGMDEGDATAMTLLTDNGLESTYLAANLRPPVAPAAHPAATAGPPERSRSSADRLRELQDLLAAGLVTQEEHDARRRAILDSL